MRPESALPGLAAAATLLAIAAPPQDQMTPAPTREDVRRLEINLAARLAAGLEGFKSPAGASQYPTDRARPLGEYVRHYALVTPGSEEDLPFTTISTPPGKSAVAGGFVEHRIAGVLVLESVMKRPAGVVLTDRQDALPRVFHQGCAVVNVVYDPEQDQLVSAWCNVP